MPNSNSIIECQNLSKKYKNKVALNDLTISIKRGRIIGLLGSNGSGKTTFIKLINGLLTPSSGNILIDGNAPGVVTKSHISYLPDQMYLNDWMKVSQLINFYADFYADFDKVKAYELLGRLRIEANQKLKTFSKGMKEKVQLTLTMSRKADLYCLDEPIAGVDPASRDYIIDTILSNYDESSTILISTHLIADLEMMLDDAIFLKDGNLIHYGSVEEIRNDHNMSLVDYFKEVYKC